LTLGEFAAGMKENQEKFATNLLNADLGPDIQAKLEGANNSVRAVVIAEDWCGDVLRYIPVLMKLTELTNWQVRVFYRDQNLDLMDNWLKDGKHKAIPVIAFFDENWNELGYYQEKPASVYIDEANAIAEFGRIHADIPDASLPYADMSQSTKDLYAPYMLSFRAKKLQSWQSLFVDQVLSLANRQHELARS
ncbi:MAG: thioredoxin family protein, partial [Chloroflexia bacterium]